MSPSWLCTRSIGGSHQGKKKPRAPRLTANTKIANTITKRQWSEKPDDYVNDCAVFSSDIISFLFFLNKNKIQQQQVTGPAFYRKNKRWVTIISTWCVFVVNIKKGSSFLFQTQVAICQRFFRLLAIPLAHRQKILYTIQHNFIQTKTTFLRYIISYRGGIHKIKKDYFIFLNNRPEREVTRDYLHSGEREREVFLLSNKNCFPRSSPIV